MTSYHNFNINNETEGFFTLSKKFQKNLPKIDNKLQQLLAGYFTTYNKPFLWYGHNLQTKLVQDWDEHNANKELKKMQRKAEHTKELQIEVILGTKTTPKRKRPITPKLNSDFYADILSSEQGKEESLRVQINQKVEEIKKLERELDVKYNEPEGVSMVTVINQLNSAMENYVEVRASRIKTLKSLRAQEKTLCEQLEMPMSCPVPEVPSAQQLENIELHVFTLQEEKVKRMQKYTSVKNRVKEILELMETDPETDFTTEVLSSSEDTFKFSGENSDCLDELLNFYEERYQQVCVERDLLINQLNNLWRKINYPACDSQQFLDTHHGIKSHIIKEDCSEEDKSAFECRKPESGGGGVAEWQNSKCGGSLPGLLCVYRENSFFIGDIFSEEKAITEGGPASFNRRLRASRKPQYFKVDVPYEEPEDEVNPGYRYGRPIKNLALPANPVIPGGYCSRSRPVQYLVDRRSTCFTEVTSSSCPELGRVVTGYLEDSLEIKVKSKKSTAAHPPIYFRSSGCFANDLSSVGGERKVCEDAVVSADYLLEWNGTRLVSVEVSVMTVDIPAPADDCSQLVYLVQSFTVSFRHASANNKTGDDSPTMKNIADTGYIIGDTLVFI